MGKSIFTVIFLIVALLAADRLKTFIDANKPEPVVEVPDNFELPPEATTTYEMYSNASTTDISTSTSEIIYN